MRSAVLDYIADVERWIGDGIELGECSWCGRAAPTGYREAGALRDAQAPHTVSSGKNGTSYRVAGWGSGLFRYCPGCKPRADRFVDLQQGRNPYRTDVPLLRIGDAKFTDAKVASQYVRELAKSVPKPKRSRRPRKSAKPKPAAKPKQAPVATSAPASVDCFRMYRRELLALGTPEAMAELERRKAKKAAKREEARTF